VDTDGDGINDKDDRRQSSVIYVDLSRHKVKPYNMIVNKDDCFIDVNFQKFPYCTLESKGEYTRQSEK